MARRWCFTVNNPVAPLAFGDDVTYAIWQLEAGEAGTPHYQGYLCLAKPKRLGGVKLLLPTAHLEPCKGTHEQNVSYCSKEPRVDGPFTHGTPPKPGERTDIAAVKRKLDDGADMSEIAEDHFSLFIRYEKGFQSYKMLKTPERSWKTRVEIHWGCSNAGKSHYAQSFEGAYWKDHGNWWDGYDGQETVVIDEFYGWLTPSFMLRLMDKTPMRVEVKGGSRQFIAKTIIITSNKPWGQWWREDVAYNHDAFERRIDLCKEYTQPYSPVVHPQGLV